MLNIDSSRLGTPPITWQQIAHTAPDNGAHSLVKSIYPIDSLTRDGNVLTLTGAFDDFRDGQLARIRTDSPPGDGDAAISKQYQVKKVDNGTLTVQISDAQVATLEAVGNSGSLWLTFDITPLRVLIHAPSTNNAGGVSIGPNSNANAKTIMPGEDYLIEMPAGYKFNLGDWYYKAAAANDVLNVLYV